MKGERGQALVELALALPILLLVTFLVLTVAEIGLARLALEHAASEGARNGSLTNDDDAIRKAVAATIAPLDPARVSVVIEPSDRGARARDSLLTVRLSYRPVIPLSFVGFSSVRVTASATRLIEWYGS